MARSVTYAEKEQNGSQLISRTPSLLYNYGVGHPAPPPELELTGFGNFTIVYECIDTECRFSMERDWL